MSSTPVKVYWLCAIGLIVLVACGGDETGDGNGARAPAVSDLAPVVVVSVSDAAPQEGQPFTLDGSGSSDPDNDPLTFSWRQLSGPLVDISNPSQATLQNLRAPEVDATETATFELAVSDGKLTRYRAIGVTFTNIHQMPRFPVEPPLVSKATLAERVEAAFANVFLSRFRYLALSSAEGADVGIRTLDISAQGDMMPGVMPLATESFRQPVVFAPTYRASLNIGDPQFYALEETRNRLSAFVKADETSPFELRGEMDIDAPCGLLEAPAAGKVVVGQRRGGFSLVNTAAADDGDAVPFALHQHLDGEESFCVLSSAYRPINASDFADYPPKFLEDMLVLDVDTATVHVFEDDGGADRDTVKYKFRESVALNLESSKPLTFVKAITVSGGFALVYTDGEHAGVHRLVVVGLDAERRVVQETHEWALGVPTDIIGSNPDGDGRPDLIVLTETSPDAVVFTAPPAAGTSFLPLTGPQFMDVGLGSTLGHQFRGAGIPVGKHYLLIADRGRKELRLYGPLP